MVVKRHLCLLTLIFMRAAVATPLQNGGENLLYFEHARLSAEYCERRGFPVRDSLESWNRANAGLHSQSIQAVRGHAERRGLSKTEQDAILVEAIENMRKQAQEHISRKGVACKNFGGVLLMYSSLFKR